jgi:hypothetical protein
MQKRQTTLVVCLFFVLPASGPTPADKKKIVIDQKESPATTKLAAINRNWFYYAYPNH